ncbi:MAG TPA: cyclic peptide export ABC transporter [Puia sp.]|nr:cyclic peptide export ABC transporter [Puia sp.]
MILVLLALSNSFFNGALLILISNAVNHTPLQLFPDYDWLVFLCLIAVSFFLARYFQLYMVNVTSSVAHEVIMDIFEKVRSASFEKFNSIGKEKVYAVIEDAHEISNLPDYLINVLNSGTVVLIGLINLFRISFAGAIPVVLMLILLTLLYLYKNVSIIKDMHEQRLLTEVYHRNIRDLLEGFKEIKMSSRRNDTFYHKFLKKNRIAFNELYLKIGAKFVNNQLTGSYSWYLLIGLILFVLPHAFSLKQEQSINYIVTLLYLMTPVIALVELLPKYSYTRVAFERLRQFNEQIKQSANAGETTVKVMLTDRKFKNLIFHGVTYEYGAGNLDGRFVLTPVDLEINQGEVLFITGGNGSGKSTFIHLLTGLFTPSAGTIWLNGEEITEENYSFYRDRISAIFSDNYLFSFNYDEYDFSDANTLFHRYLALMELSEVVRIHPKNNSIDNALSSGQKKRLAMIYALMEDKDILVLDEWAADQDPTYRSYFYNVLLPKLKADGKTIVAVTHDDAYFNHADRIITFESGRIIRQKKGMGGAIISFPKGGIDIDTEEDFQKIS